MRKKTLFVIGLLVAFLVIQGCTSKPEKSLLSRYFNAVTLNDNDTMSSMALEPFQPEMTSWNIVSISPEKIEPAKLPGLNKAEIEAKKAQDAQIGPTIDADTLARPLPRGRSTSFRPSTMRRTPRCRRSRRTITPPRRRPPRKRR
jgi:hypothetical protein